MPILGLVAVWVAMTGGIFVTMFFLVRFFARREADKKYAECMAELKNLRSNPFAKDHEWMRVLRYAVAADLAQEKAYGKKAKPLLAEMVRMSAEQCGQRLFPYTGTPVSV